MYQLSGFFYISFREIASVWNPTILLAEKTFGKPFLISISYHKKERFSFVEKKPSKKSLHYTYADVENVWADLHNDIALFHQDLHKVLRKIVVDQVHNFMFHHFHEPWNPWMTILPIF